LTTFKKISQTSKQSAPAVREELAAHRKRGQGSRPVEVDDGLGVLRVRVEVVVVHARRKVERRAAHRAAVAATETG
jgi:hypothetical protein